MEKIGAWLRTTIGRKQIVGVTGLGLSVFVLVHMAGNLLIFVSAEAYNKYGHALITNPLIEVAELGLVAMVLGHLILSLALAVLAKKARPDSYRGVAAGPKATTWVQKTLWLQGLLIISFLILHLISFKYGEVYTVSYEGVEMRDLHRLVIEKFSMPIYVIGYVVALLVLGMHLGHGIQSVFKTLGFNHPRYETAVQVVSRIYALVVAGGFIAQPLYVFFIFKG